MHIDLTRRPRTKRAFAHADMLKMRDLYYDRDVPMTHVAAAFGVPVSTFLRWIAEMDWPRRSPSGPGPRRAVYPYPVTPRVARQMQGAPPFEAPASQALRREDAPSAEDSVVRGSPPGTRASKVEDFDPRRAGQPPSIGFSAEIAAVARKELAALGDPDALANRALTLPDRERRAKIVASLADTVERMERFHETSTRVMVLVEKVFQVHELMQAKQSRRQDDVITEAQKLLEGAVLAQMQKMIA